MARWIKTNFRGVRYHEHETRKHGVQHDKYFTIRYKLAGKDKEEGLGWASDGWTASKAYDRLKELKENRKIGHGPQTLKEKRELLQDKRKAEKVESERIKREAVTLGSYFNDTYLSEAQSEKKESSIKREKELFKLWIGPAIGHLPMKDIALLDMDRLKKKMVDSKRSPRSIEYTFAVIRHIFNRARHHNKFAGENPLKGFKFPKPDNARMRFLTHEEADALLNLLKEKSADVHDMTLLSLHCGLRFGEIAALTWQDVDLERGTLTIRDAKAGSRYAFLTEQAAEMLRTRPKGKPSNYVFIGRAGQLKYISLTFKRAVDELKLNNGIDDKRLKIVFHSARHSYASWLIEEGVDLFTVQKLLGHKTNVMTQRYAHMAENRLKGAANALSKAFQKHDGGQVVNFKK